MSGSKKDLNKGKILEEKQIQESQGEEDAPKSDESVNIEISEGEDHAPSIPDVINILPLRDAVIYPMLISPLNVSRASSVRLIDDSIAENYRIIGVVAQRKPQTERPGFDDTYEYGCAIIIRTMVKSTDAVRLIIQGVSRFKIIERLQEEPYLRAKVEILEEPSLPEGVDEEVEALRRSIASLFDQAIRLSNQLPEELLSLTSAVNEPHVMADLVAAHLPIALEKKQAILEAIDLKTRLKLLLDIVSHEVRVLELTTKVQSEVTAELTKTQREYYLREQLKAIQRELGEIDDRGEDLEEIREKIDSSDLPQEALKEVNREYDRLRRMNPGAPEYTVARTYIDWMLAMPWNTSTEDVLELKVVKSVLDKDHYGLEKIKERILEFLAVRKVKTDGSLRQPMLCFVGPPGVGKTSLGRSIAHAMERKFVRISLGGMRDEAEIRGHRRTYVGALPGQIIQGIRRVETNNPVFVLDELDKLGNDFRGDPSSALLEVLDPQQNSTFRDHYLDVAFDLSKVFFIATANRLDTIPAPLRDRMEVIDVSGYTEEEKCQIAHRHLIPKQLEEHGLKKAQLSFTVDAVHKLVRQYTREAGVRGLEREVATVIRKATRKFAEGRKGKVIANSKFIETSLGAPRYLHDEIDEREFTPGIVTGLAWTAVGGEILFIEATKMSGAKSLTITGQLGDVMKESTQAALSYVRTHAEELGINPKFYEESDIHVHVPAGAVPKDGPSAGVTMLTALVSLLKGECVQEKLAMTGEITLKGQVLAVGGIKEKVLAAFRAGVRTILLPNDNKKDYYEQVPEEIRKKLRVHFVKHAKEVIALAFLNSRKQKR